MLGLHYISPKTSGFKVSEGTLIPKCLWIQAQLKDLSFLCGHKTRILYLYPSKVIRSLLSCHSEFKKNEYQIKPHNRLPHHGGLYFELYNFQKTRDGWVFHSAFLNAPELMLMPSLAPKLINLTSGRTSPNIGKTIHASPHLCSSTHVLLPSFSNNIGAKQSFSWDNNCMRNHWTCFLLPNLGIKF